jgi:hypothetical protein
MPSSLHPNITQNFVGSLFLLAKISNASNLGGPLMFLHGKAMPIVIL